MRYLIFIGCLLFVSCNLKSKEEIIAFSPSPEVLFSPLTLAQAEKLLVLPLSCIYKEYPNKLGQVLSDHSELKPPKELSPVFYGCFDWHSSVHGYWSIVYLIKKYPQLIATYDLENILNESFTQENVATELAFFKQEHNKNFERTYGWAWLLKLYAEIKDWEGYELAQNWAKNLEPLVFYIEEQYFNYLHLLTYPIRTGTHDNTAFSLSLFLDYAHQKGDKELISFIQYQAKRFFLEDIACPLSYEPSGHDFLSPCLEEAHLMSKVLDNEVFSSWLKEFLPSMYQEHFQLSVAEVTDRSDGHLVHLDGLNFSRATCLYGLAEYHPQPSLLNAAAYSLFINSLEVIFDDDYMGSHWLGTYALLVYDQMGKSR